MTSLFFGHLDKKRPFHGKTWWNFLVWTTWKANFDFELEDFSYFQLFSKSQCKKSCLCVKDEQVISFWLLNNALSCCISYFTGIYSWIGVNFELGRFDHSHDSQGILLTSSVDGIIFSGFYSNKFNLWLDEWVMTSWEISITLYIPVSVFIFSLLLSINFLVYW